MFANLQVVVKVKLDLFPSHGSNIIVKEHKTNLLLILQFLKVKPILNCWKSSVVNLVKSNLDPLFMDKQ